MWHALISGSTLLASLIAGSSGPAFAGAEASLRDDAGAIVIRVPAQQSTIGASPPPSSERRHQPTALTLQSALQLARTLRRSSPKPVPIVIELGAGLHRLADAVRIGSEDSGSETTPLVIRGSPSGETVLSGSVALSPIEPAELAAVPVSRLPPQARSAVKFYRLPDTARRAGSIDIPRVHDLEPDLLPFEVFDADGPLSPARWPNAGYADAASLAAGPTGTRFILNDPRIAAWSAEPDVWANGNFRWNWNYETKRIARVLPGHEGIELSTPPQFGFGPDLRVFVSHALAELDIPGEWYRHRATGTLIVWPRTGIGSDIEISVAAQLLDLRDVSHVRIENLAFERVRGSAITVRGGADVRLSGVTIRHTGGAAAKFENARDSGIEDCVIAGSGEGGVRLSGGNRPSLIPANLYVRNCQIQNFSRLGRTYRSAIRLDGVGNSAIGNYIAHAPHTAISFFGNDHLIELNEITNVLTDTSDAGAIDTGRDWTGQGTIIRNNFLHDLRGGQPGSEVKGIYLDDFTSGVTVEGNVFWRVEQPVFIGGGRDNIVQGNLMVGSEPGIHIDGRGLTWNGELVWNTDRELRTRLATMPIASALWKQRYPGLATILSDDPARAKRNRAEGNLFISGIPYRIYPEVETSEQSLQDAWTPSVLGLATPDLPALPRARDIPSLLGDDLLSAAHLRGLPFDYMDRNEILSLRQRRQ